MGYSRSTPIIEYVFGYSLIIIAPWPMHSSIIRTIACTYFMVAKMSIASCLKCSRVGNSTFQLTCEAQSSAVH